MVCHGAGADFLRITLLSLHPKIRYDIRDFGTSWSLQSELLENRATSRMDESQIAQPASTALQIALVDLLASINISPRMVLGHSSGEIGAATLLA